MNLLWIDLPTFIFQAVNLSSFLRFNVAKCNLGKVNLEAILVSSLPSYTRGSPVPLAGAPRDLYTQLLACSSSQSVVAIACCLRAILCSLPLEVLACTQTLFYFSFRSFQKQRRTREPSQRARNHPLALAVNKSPAVYILSPALDGLRRENRGSVNRLLTYGPGKYWSVSIPLNCSEWRCLVQAAHRVAMDTSSSCQSIARLHQLCIHQRPSSSIGDVFNTWITLNLNNHNFISYSSVISASFAFKEIASIHFISFIYWFIQIFTILFSHCPEIAKATLGGRCLFKTKHALMVLFSN